MARGVRSLSRAARRAGALAAAAARDVTAAFGDVAPGRVPGIARWRNWGRTQTCRPARIERPVDTAAVVDVVRRAVADGLVVRPVGAGHSFSALVPTDGVLVSADRMVGVTSVGTAADGAPTVTLRAGTPLLAAADAMARRGLAFSVLGDIGVQHVAGAVGTATHGTGERFGGLSSYVCGIELVDGTGTPRTVGPDDPALAAAAVHLGALGVVTSVTMRCEERFNLRTATQALDVDDCVARFDELSAAHDHCEFFWFPYTDTALVVTHDRTTESPSAVLRDRLARDLSAFVDGNWAWDAAQRAVAGDRRRAAGLNRAVAAGFRDDVTVDRADRAFTNRRRVRFAETEWAVPRDRLAEVLAAVRALVDDGPWAVTFPVEVRTSAADDTMLGPASGRATAWVALHTHRDAPAPDYLAAAQEILAGAGGRPHWGKLHALGAAALAPRYPRWDEFAAVRAEFDPDGVFASPGLDAVLGPVVTAAGSRSSRTAAPSTPGTSPRRRASSFARRTSR